MIDVTVQLSGIYLFLFIFLIALLIQLFIYIQPKNLSSNLIHFILF